MGMCVCLCVCHTIQSSNDGSSDLCGASFCFVLFCFFSPIVGRKGNPPARMMRSSKVPKEPQGDESSAPHAHQFRCAPAEERKTSAKRTS